MFVFANFWRFGSIITRKYYIITFFFDFFVAGAETSSSTLAWAIVFMTLNQDVQEKTAQEIKSHLGLRLPSQDDLSK